MKNPERTMNKTDAYFLNSLVTTVGINNKKAGWDDVPDGIMCQLNVESEKDFKNYEAATMIALIHSELSEALEGLRKDLMDDHLPHRRMVEVELADAVIRIFHAASRLELDLGGAVVEKFAYNKERLDHKKENREKNGGKKF